MLEGFKMGRNGMVVSHLQLVDDTIVMCKNPACQIKYLRCVIRCNKAVLGLKVNLGKSSMYGVGLIDNLERLAEVFGCQIGEFSTTYLGLPLGAPFKNKERWNKVLDRAHKRLARLTGMHLSKGGRMTLIKLVLSSLPTYYLSFCDSYVSGQEHREVPKGLFFREKGGEGEGPHLVVWEEIC